MPTNSLLESAPDVHHFRQERSHTDALTEIILDHLNEQTVITSGFAHLPHAPIHMESNLPPRRPTCPMQQGRPSPTPIRLHALFHQFPGITTSFHAGC